MNVLIQAVPEHAEARIQRDLARGLLQSLEGTVQRVDYKGRELKLVSQGQVWYLKVAADCQLWFDDQPAILRCFHPLDQVEVVYEQSEHGPTVKAMYARERN